MSDTEPTLADKLQGLSDSGYELVTVATLVNILAGLPPGLPVFVGAKETLSNGKISFERNNYLFVNSYEILPQKDNEQVVGAVLVLNAERFPIRPPADTRTVDEQTAAQQQRAMQLTKNIDEAMTFPDEVIGK